jgi:hypothetical protein
MGVALGRRWPLTPYRREMRRRFPRALYRRRWHAESVFSRLKRRLGSALTARSGRSQRREILLRVLTYNLMILRLRRQRISTEQNCFTRVGHWHRVACAALAREPSRLARPEAPMPGTRPARTRPSFPLLPLFPWRSARAPPGPPTAWRRRVTIAARPLRSLLCGVTVRKRTLSGSVLGPVPDVGARRATPYAVRGGGAGAIPT